jgi:hypothetical protein
MPRNFLLLLFFFIGTAATAQRLDSLLDIQRGADPREKLHVHFDKNFYNPGETIWFKAYFFTGNEPSGISKNFYADLVDEKGTVITQFTAPIFFAGSSGSIQLDSALNKPVLFFRGYTIAMLNGDTSFLYTKALRILVPGGSQIIAAKPSPPTLKLLPEGGDMINGVLATIAFAATNSAGNPVAITGYVADDKGTKLADLTTLHRGMGIVRLQPEAGRQYTAHWKDESGRQYTTPLPRPQEQGVNLQVTAEPNGNKRFTITRSAGVPAESKRLYVAASMNQTLAFEARIDMENRTTASGVFPTREMNSGILQITVFNAARQPLAERIVFVNNKDFEMDGDAYLTLKNFKPRGLNEVEIMMSDTVPANFSLSITDAGLNESNRMDDNLVSRMLLTGDLRGKITDPYYYFFSNGDSVGFFLDLVMMTHGWRRYNWEQVWAGKTNPPKWKESNYLAMDGKVNGLPPGAFAADLQLTGIVQTADSAKSFVVLPVDRQGNVFTDGLVFYDKAKLFFNFNKKSVMFDKSMLLVDNGLRKGYKKVQVDSVHWLGLPNLFPETIAANTQAAQRARQAAKKLADVKMLDVVTVTTKAKTAKEKMEEKYVSGLFAGDGNSFDLVNDPLANAYMSILQYLQGRVAGLQITTGGAGATLSWRGGTPALYLNEMRSDVDMITSIPVSDIAYVKVLRPGSSVVSGGGGGVIAVYTRKGGDAQPDPNTRSLNFVQLTGYSPVKEFYSPDYATFSERAAVEDVRTTLYWNPQIFLDKSRRRVRIRFYNNDITSHFRLVLEGFNAAGKLIHVEKEVLF